MTVLVWDEVGSRIYESGLDKGVLYLPDRSAVPWNGLTSVTEKFDTAANPIYFDGQKINDLVAVGDFSGTINAVTYPDEFIELEGFVSPRKGMYVGNQHPQSFNLCYRTRVGNDLEDDAYILHIIYNVIATPAETTYATLTDNVNLNVFQWNIEAIPEEVTAFRPTAYVRIDSRHFDPQLLIELEKMLYGTETTAPGLLPLTDLIEFLDTWFSIQILDNGDGTWTAISDDDSLIDEAGEEFTIYKANAYYLSDDAFVISDTKDVEDIPLIKIHEVGDGTWTAAVDDPDLLTTLAPGEVEIQEANIEVVSAESYTITDTPS